MGQLSEQEKQILVQSALRADSDASEIAKICGCSTGTVRYTLNKLLANGTIIARNYIDVFQLGLNSYVMLFSLRSTKDEFRAQVIKYLSELTGVVWFAEVGGEFQFIMNICQGDAHRLNEQLDKIGAKFGNPFVNKVIAQHLSYRDYSYGYLSPKHFPSDFVGTEIRRKRFDFDEIDHKILKAIAPAPLSQREVGKATGLATSTVQYRTERLKQIGVWKRTIYLVNYTALGLSSGLMLLYANTSCAKFRRELHEFCLADANIVTLTESIGAWDFEIIAIGNTPEELRKLKDKILDKFSLQLHAVTAIPCYRLIKWNQYPFETFADYRNSLTQHETEQAIKVNTSNVSSKFEHDTLRVGNVD